MLNLAHLKQGSPAFKGKIFIEKHPRGYYNDPEVESIVVPEDRDKRLKELIKSCKLPSQMQLVPNKELQPIIDAVETLQLVYGKKSIDIGQLYGAASYCHDNSRLVIENPQGKSVEGDGGLRITIDLNA